MDSSHYPLFKHVSLVYERIYVYHRPIRSTSETIVFKTGSLPPRGFSLLCERRNHTPIRNLRSDLEATVLKGSQVATPGLET